ncbi:MAG: hypothetical protein H7837_10895 [Magnetococcus sp. MYC-9]
MGIAAAVSHLTPSRSQPPPPPAAKMEARATKKCHLLPFQCHGCGAAMNVRYPLSVTFWKFACSACNKPYSIEIIGNRKCLVYDQLGRRTAERIGLTQERSTYYRARCYHCNNTVIVAKQAANKIHSCHHCQLDFTMREVHGTVFYETVIRHQANPVMFRDKVQILEGHILNTGNMFFLDEDIGGRSQQEWIDLIGQLEDELATLRGQGDVSQTALMRLQAEKNSLQQQLQQQTEQSAELGTRVQGLEEQLRNLSAEKQTQEEYMGRHKEIIRQLGQKAAISTRLENRIEILNRTIRELHDEKQELLGRLAGQTELLKRLEQERGGNRDAQKPLQAELQRLQQENRALTEKVNNSHTLLREQERRSERAARLETRLIELETELNLLRQRGSGERPEPKEEWYCEEGEEALISPHEKGFQERRILGIKGEPTPERVKAALRRRIRKYHPDRVASMGLELREVAHRKTQEITHAYSQLMLQCARG